MPESPSYEELAVLVRAQAEEIARLKAKVLELEATVAELRVKGGRNSKNSSKPPSSDGPDADAKRSRGKSKRKPGKQPGKPGRWLQRIDSPDEVIDDEPDVCRGCGSGLSEVEPTGEPISRQVVDVPQITPAVVEHRMYRKRCACGTVTVADAPAEATAAVVYGPNLQALAAYLVVYRHLPIALTAYHLDPGRGRAAIDAFGILGGQGPNYAGIAVHDCWAAYHGYQHCSHAFCGAHIARELVAAEDDNPAQAWPTAARQALLDLNTAAHQARASGRKKIPAKVADPLLKQWKHAILCGLAAHPRAPGKKQSKTRNLLQRLHGNNEQVQRFARDLSVPFTNNQAERDLRPTKPK